MIILTIIFFITMMITNCSIMIGVWKSFVKKAPKSPLHCSMEGCGCEADVISAGNTYCNGHA